ncbi:MAG: PAS domain-containing sensor histidine kinase [Candidatus Helarchaeota archaeon]
MLNEPTISSELESVFGDLENSLDGIFVLDINNHTLIYVNKTFADLIGFSKESLININFLDLIHPHDKKKFLKFITKINKLNMRQKYFSLKVLNSLKNTIDVEIVGTLFGSRKKKSHFFGIMRDITKTKRLETAFIKREIDFKDISESINDAICIIKTNGKFIYVSPRLPVILGGKTIGDDFYKLIHPDDLSYVVKKLKNSIKNKNLIYLESIQFRATHSKLGYIWLEANTRKYFENNEILIGFLIVLRDIHERKLLEEELKRYHRELEEKNRALREADELKSNFLSNSAHELLTPLISIKGFTELFLKYNKLTEDQINDILTIQRNTERLIFLVNNILDVSELESDKVIIKKDRFDIKKLVLECLDEVKFKLEDRKQKINLELPENEVMVVADNKRIRQLLINLMDNAIKFTQYNGNIGICLREEDDKVHFCIKDTGIGLTSNEINKLFRRFGKVYSTDCNFKVDSSGTGLGLFICKRIVEKHNGKIWAFSDGKNRGAEFHFLINKFLPQL